MSRRRSVLGWKTNSDVRITWSCDHWATSILDCTAFSNVASNPCESCPAIRHGFMTICHSQHAKFSVLRVEGALRAPLRHELSRKVQTLLDRGERRFVVDLSRLVAMDAAGVGELVRAFSATCAAGGVLRMTRAGRRVRQMLQIAGVLPLLMARPDVSRDDSVALGA